MTEPAPLKLPEYVIQCPSCGGTGEYRQTYTAGCGGGYYRAMGPCYLCYDPDTYTMKGYGFLYEATYTKVSQSVVDQIKVMNSG